MDNIFAKIIRGEIPAAKIYEDETTLAFLDIQPSNKGHALVIPKKEYQNVFDMDADTFAAVARTAHKVAHAVKTATNAEGVNINMNNGEAAGQEVFHAHVHIIPRFTDDQVFQPARHTQYAEGEIDEIAQNIRDAFTE